MGISADTRHRELVATSQGVKLIDREQTPAEADGDFVLFLETGEAAKGSFRCAECGYGVVVTGGLPVCPMCGGTAWEISEWSPFGRSSLL